MHRIHDFIITDKAEIASMFRPFDSSLTILDFSLMKESMSNTGYAVTTNAGKSVFRHRARPDCAAALRQPKRRRRRAAAVFPCRIIYR